MLGSLIRLSFIIFALATSLTQAQRKGPANKNQSPLSAKQIARRVLPSVVLVETACGRGRVVFGSGFVVDRGLMATNRHVVDCGNEEYITLVSQAARHRVIAKYLDAAQDLALLKVEGLNAPALQLSGAQHLSVGDKVYAAGNPRGLEGTFSDGIISSLRFPAGRIQFTAAISSGSSGGPVIDEYGLVIGVTFSYLEGGQNLNFAVPSLFLKNLIADVRSGKVSETLEAKAPTSPTTIPMRRAGSVGYTLIIDNSKSLAKQLAFVKQAARALIEHNVGDDATKVVSFGWRGESRFEPFLTDRQRLLNIVEAVEMRIDGSTTPVIDTMYRSLARVSSEGRPVETANGIVVLTHGMDGVSEHTWDELISLARTTRVPIYCVLFTPDSPNWDLVSDLSERLVKIRTWMERQRTSEQSLRTLAQETGGQLFIPVNKEQLPQFAREIMRALHVLLPR